MSDARGFGVDVGGSGIKGSVVDVGTGHLAQVRVRLPTPVPSTPPAVAEAVAEVVARFGWDGPVGVALPCVVKDGTTLTAANIDHGWLQTDARAVLSGRLGGREIAVLNDADAAGLAEVRFGAGRGHHGVVVLLTFGTGIGSALFLDGELVPNTELGHLEVDGHDAETRAAASVKEEHHMSWEKWANRVSRYIRVLEDLVWPDMVVVGGGVSRRAERWVPLLEVRTRVVAATLHNDAGIVGAALAARERLAR